MPFPAHHAAAATGPQRIAPGTGPWPLHDVAGTRRLETRALAAHPPHTLMQRAGTAVARLALALAPGARSVLVLAGPGNNGGDGLVAARRLHGLGVPVRVVLAADPARLPADAAWAHRDALAAGVPVVHGPAHDAPLPAADLVVDALLGLGVTRAPEGVIARLLARAAALRQQGARVLAVDLPSGLDADTGNAPEGVLDADWTLSLLTLKPGLFTHHGRDLAGEVWLDRLGVATEAAEAAEAADPAPTAQLSGPWQPALRPHATHKGAFGEVLAVGGAAGMGGALQLAARAALAAGAGRVTLSGVGDGGTDHDPAWPELMSHPAAWALPPARLGVATVVCGCGGGPGLGVVLPPLLQHAARLVLDADGLNAVAADPGLRAALRARAARGLATLLTPHPLEAARLLGCGTATVQADRLRAATGLAEALQCTVVLKGSGTVVARPAGHGLPQINPSGNAALATAGTGDVLAGWIAGHWAASAAAPGTAPADAAALAARVAAQAVWWHGHAADLYRARGHHGPLRAAALIEAMARAG